MRKRRITPALDSPAAKLWRASGSSNKAESLAAMEQIALAFENPIRKGILSGDITKGIYSPIELAPGATPLFELDTLSPGTEKDFVAYTMPGAGFIPYRHVEADYIMVPTYTIAGAIDWDLRMARESRWDVAARQEENLRGQFTKKINDDAWQTIMAAAYDRNLIVADSDANAGQFTVRLISLMKTVMRRNGGGNSTSLNRSRLTDLFISPEAQEDVRNWNVDQVDDVTRRELLMSEGDEVLMRLFGVNIDTLDELGEGQEYQLFFDNDLAGTMPGTDVELVVGLDLQREDSFVMPIREQVSLYVDDNLHRKGEAGLYGRGEMGFAVLDSRRVLFGSM